MDNYHSMGIVNSVKFEEKLRKRLSLTNFDVWNNKEITQESQLYSSRDYI